MKKFFAAIFILAIFAGVIFYFGWVQFAIPAGYTGVMISKTGGINSSPIVPGVFRWSWEPLLPTNCKIISFSMRPVELALNTSGSLASGDLYVRFLEGSPNFSYSLSANFSLRAAQDNLPLIIEEYSIESDDELNALLEELGQKAFYSATEKYIAAQVQNAAAARSQEEAAAPPPPAASSIEALFKEEMPKWIATVSFSVAECTLPDFALYAEGASIYAEYSARRSEVAVAAAVKAAEEEIASEEQMRLFAEWGEFIQKFPLLIDFLAVARDNASDTLELLRSLKNGGSLESAKEEARPQGEEEASSP